MRLARLLKKNKLSDWMRLTTHLHRVPVVIFIFYSWISGALLGCTPHINVATYSLKLESAPSTTNYTATSFVTAPVFAMYSSSSGGLQTAYAESLQLQAFSDSGLSIAAPGVLSASTSQVVTSIPFQSGYAYSSQLNYTLATDLEETIYLQAQASSSTVSTSALSIVHYFIKGAGYATFQPGGNGASGAPDSSKDDVAKSLQADTSGRYVVAGSSLNSAGGTEMALWRYFPDGIPDSSFGSTGGLTFQPGGLGAAGASNATKVDVGYSLQLDSSGNLIVVGSSANGLGGTEMAIWRYLPNGNPDTSFSATGAVTFQPGGLGAAGASNITKLDVGYSLQIDSSGNYVIIGSSANGLGGTEMAVWRFLPNGNADLSFSATGAITFQPGGNGAAGSGNATKNDEGYSLQLDTSGNYIVSGSSLNAAGGTEMAMWRILPSGSFDASFNATGAVTFQPGGNGAAGAGNAVKIDVANSLALDSSGNYVSIGSSANGLGGTEMAIWRFLPTASPDTSFSATGAVTFQPGGNGAAGAGNTTKVDNGYSLQLDSSGNYIIAGNSLNSAGGTEMAIWRFLSTGTADSSWNSTGAVTFQPGGNGAAGAGNTVKLDIGAALIIDSHLRYVVAGSSLNSVPTSEMAIWRYLPATGLLDM